MTPSRSRKSSMTAGEGDSGLGKSSGQAQTEGKPQLSSIDQRRARRKQLNLRENLSPQQLQMSGDYLQGQASEFDNKTTGRWSREEHEKFIEGKFYF